jgi:hypothetical protein
LGIPPQELVRRWAEYPYERLLDLTTNWGIIPTQYFRGRKEKKGVCGHIGLAKNVF